MGNNQQTLIPLNNAPLDPQQCLIVNIRRYYLNTIGVTFISHKLILQPIGDIDIIFSDENDIGCVN